MNIFNPRLPPPLWRPPRRPCVASGPSAPGRRNPRQFKRTWLRRAKLYCDLGSHGADATIRRAEQAEMAKAEKESLIFKGFRKSFLVFFGPFWGAPGAEIWPECGPRDQLSNPNVSSKSGQWRPDPWQETFFKNYQIWRNSSSAHCISAYSECRTITRWHSCALVSIAPRTF